MIYWHHKYLPDSCAVCCYLLCCLLWVRTGAAAGVLRPDRGAGGHLLLSGGAYRCPDQFFAGKRLLISGIVGVDEGAVRIIGVGVTVGVGVVRG